MHRPIGCWRLNLRPSGRCRSTCHNTPSGKVILRLTDRALRPLAFFSRGGGIYPSTILGWFPSPPLRGREEPYSLSLAGSVRPQLHVLCLGGGGAVAANSAA